MEQSPHDTTEVMIVGAGPTGLMMACQLAVHRISFRIIDKNTNSSQNSGALIVQARSLEIFEQLGIAGEAIKQGIIADGIEILCNGKKIACTSIKDIGGHLSQFPFLLMLEQSKTEKLMLDFLQKRGCHVERNVQFKEFAEDANVITTNVILPDGSEQTILSKYLIGADGSKSDIRKFLNIPFQGKTYSRPIFILDCEATTELKPGVISFAFSDTSVAGFFPLVNGRWRIDGSFPLQHWNKLNFQVHYTEWFSVSHSQQKYAHTIRIGNCFLAGDSAHVNTPVGAQGMNTGLQDAHNLAWKLAFVLKQKAKPELLDSYSTERLGISRGFAHYADAIFKLLTNTNTAVRLFRTFALKMYFKRIFPILVNKEKSRLKFFRSISQIDIHYKSAYRLPYVEFILNNDKTNSHKILDPSEFTLLVFAEVLTPEMQAISMKYKLAAVLLKRLPGTEKIYATLGIRDSGYYLIRPDMYIQLRSPNLETDILNRYFFHILTTVV